MQVATLQEVVVTAQKREEKLHDVPMGVSAITGGRSRCNDSSISRTS